MQATFWIGVSILATLSALLLPKVSSLNVLTTGKPVSNCTKKYGDQPATRTNSIDGLLAFVKLCVNISRHAEVLSFTDSNGERRRACLVRTPSSKALPLLVWLHPSLAPPSSIFLTNLLFEANSANLTGTIDGPLGYHLLLPLGRDTTHIYPAPDKKGLGWDNWYRNYNRSDPACNVDVQLIDYVIARSIEKLSKLVDVSRVFMSGWSNGAAMALQYALNTPSIAAAAVYSAPDPYRDIQDPCAQVPYPADLTPILALYNQCDVFGICATGQSFFKDLNNRYPKSLDAEGVIFNSTFKIVTTCILSCTSVIGLGLAQHMRWPVILNDQIFFHFFRQHHLSSS